MEIKASLNNLRIGPRKVRLIVDLIRGLDASDAISQLEYLNKKSSQHIIKLIKSAISNAENNYKLQKDKLFIKNITVDADKTYKRWMPRAFGRAGAIRKRGSKVNVVLAERS